MIQYKQILITLALLLTAVTGAWADGKVYTSAVDITALQVGDILTEGASITGSGTIYFDLNRAKWDGTLHTEGTMYLNTDDFDSFGAEGVISLSNNTTMSPVDKDNNDGNAWEVTNVHIEANNNYINIQGITYAPAVIEVNGPTIVEGKPQWTFTQPGYDVMLTPVYAPAAAFATTGTEPNVKTLAPTAAKGVIAGTDAPLIVEGTVATAGTTENPQGLVMYAVTTTNTTAPALSAFSTDVPTAADIADDGATVYVWYYIKGTDTPDGQEATAENTFNDSEICATPLEVSVLSNQFDLTFNALNVNTIDATQASKGTVTVKVGTAAAVDKTGDITDEGKLEAIKMGSEVKLNAKQGYKFRKVQVKNAGPGPLTYATKEGAVTRIKFYTGSDEFYADFTYSNGSFTRTGGSNGYGFSGSWTMKEENGVLTMTANYNVTNTQYLYFVCTFYVDTNEYTVSSTGEWNYSFRGIEVNGNDITDQLTNVK